MMKVQSQPTTAELLAELRRHETDYPSLVHGPLCGQAADRIEELEGALRTLARWRSINLQGEYEHGLRGIIRSMVDCAEAALQPEVRS